MPRQRVFVRKRGAYFVVIDWPEHTYFRSTLATVRTRRDLNERLKNMADDADRDGIQFIVVDRTRGERCSG